MAKKNSNLIGSWAFLIGVVVAVIVALFSKIDSTLALILVVIGLVVGLLNVADKETASFLMSGVVLIIAGALGGGIMIIVPKAQAVLGALLLIFVPATIIVAIKNVFSLAKN